MNTEQSALPVSVVIVSFNGKHLLGDCLASLSRQTYRRFETVVVDNGSTDGSADFLRSAGVKVVRLEVNQGFTGGSIAGLNAASGELIALLNDDATPDETWLAELVKAMSEHPEAGICASRIVLADAPDRIDSAGDGCTTAGYGFKLGHGKPADLYGSPAWVFGACGAAALYRKSLFDEMGFVDDSFFLFFEDTDLSFRAQLAGWKCRYVPSAVARHKFRATVGRESAQEVYYCSRNSELVWVKNMPLSLAIRYLHHKAVQEVLDFVKFGIICRHPLAFIRGKASAFRMLPAALRKRRELQRRRKASDGYISSILAPAWDSGLLRDKVRRLLERFGRR